MSNQGALIIVPKATGDAGEGVGLHRFGARTLLEKLVQEICAAMAHTVVAPVETALSQGMLRKLGDRATVGAPCPEPSMPTCALEQALRLFPATIQSEAVRTVAVFTADLPYLEASHLQELSKALPREADGICVADGERKHPLLGVYRREALARACKSGGHKDGAAFWEMLRIHSMPAAGVAADPPGLTIVTRLDSPQAYRRALAHHGLCEPTDPAITLELYGNLRIRTGCGALPMRAGDVGTAFRVFRAVYPEAARWMPENEDLPEHFRFSINGGEVTTNLDHALQENDQLILFSATVGG